jgi:hypothetical protein
MAPGAGAARALALYRRLLREARQVRRRGGGRGGGAARCRCPARRARPPRPAKPARPPQMPTLNRQRFVRQRAREGFEQGRGAVGEDLEQLLLLAETQLENAAVQRRVLADLHRSGNLKGPKH